MGTWEQVRVGLLGQIRHPDFWLVLAVGLAIGLVMVAPLIRRRRWPALPTVLAVAWIALVAALTWRGQSPVQDADQGLREFLAGLVRPGAWRDAAGQDLTGGYAAANILLFIPVGLLLALASRRWWFGMVGGLALTILVEAQQAARYGEGRLDDVVTNAVGALIGAAIAVVPLWLGARGTDTDHTSADRADRPGAGAGETTGARPADR